MPANIPSLPAAAAATAQLALNGSADPAGPSAGSAKGVEPFAALFRQLMGRPAGGDADLMKQLPLTADAATDENTDPGEAASNLDALLPFLEAVGLVLPAQPDKAESQDIPAETGTVAALAVPAAIQPGGDSVQPAISAAETSRRTGGEARADIPVAGAIPPSVTAPAAEAAAVAAPAANVRDTDTAQSKEPSPGREFSSQLVAAIAASKEEPRTPGSVAAAVHQVIATASPRNADAANTEGKPAHSDKTVAALPEVVAGAVPRNADAESIEAGHAPDSTAATTHPIIAGVSPGNNQAGETARAATPAVTQAVGSPGWSDEIGSRIVWMANRMESKAELVLTPPQMGRVEVSLSISGDQATASFISGNAAVREALEAALPRLREVLADAGIQLGQAQVGAENARQSAQQEKNADNFGLARGTRADNAGLHARSGGLSANAGLKTGRGLVDVFA